MRRVVSVTCLTVFLLSACTPVAQPGDSSSSAPVSEQTASSPSSVAPHASDDVTLGGAATANAAGFGGNVAYTEPAVNINAQLAADFSFDDVKNLTAMADAYGIKLTDAERKQLADQKFILKRLTDTTIVPELTGENGREFLGLYNAVAGKDAKARTQANALFWSADIFLHSYSLLQVELLKEMENTAFAPAMRTLSKTFYTASAEKLAKASTDAEKKKWMKVRNYFAVPHALLSTSIAPLTQESYYQENGGMKNPEAVKAEFDTADKAADTEAKAKAFIDGLNLDAESKAAVLEDVRQIFAAKEPAVPAVFAPEYKAYQEATNVGFKVDFTQFTPRSHYTSSSFRRQYFRAMNWYIQLPFFVKSDALTDYAFGISQLMSEHPDQLKSYGLLESTVNFMVGTSDDLMPQDYLRAMEETKGKPDQAAAIRAFLLKAKPPRIKSIAAAYPAVGTVQSADVLALTTGMRFFSGKFILDSYWTGYLTQGDEAPRPGYPSKLPHMASVLEVMGLLGSDYARSKIPTLDFYTPENGKAVDKAMAELTEETKAMTEADWRENAYTTELWAIKGLFGFEQANRAKLPRFMQGAAWPAKTLQTAAGAWTELRHAVLLYAKQSFAELGGGAPCDPRKVPDPAKAYIEPQIVTYTRMQYLAKRMHQGLKDLGFTLKNFYPLEAYIEMMDTVIDYTNKELANTALTETVVENTYDDEFNPGQKCVSYDITHSDWETLRKDLVDKLNYALPVPVEGPVLPAKDKRAALVADVHTGGDTPHPHEILYEGIGVPYVILTAVKDVNGPRLGIGFTYSHFETRKPLGGPRMTDEDWQKIFYEGTDDNDAFRYTKPVTWPAVNSWYAPLFPSK